MNSTSYQKERGLRLFFQHHDQFSHKEQKIIKLLLDRHSNKEIATQLFLSEGTIKNNLSTIYAKLNVNNWQEAVDFLNQWMKKHL